MLTDGGAAAGGAGGNTGTAGAPAGQGSGGSFVVGQQQGTGAGQSQGGQNGNGGSGGGSRYEQYADRSQRFLDKYGPERAVDMLMRENADYRETERQLRSELDARPALPAGAVVLVGNDVAEWQALRQLNLPAAQIRERIDEHGRLKAESGRAHTLTVAEKAAAAYGWGSAVAIGELVTDKGLTLEMRDTTVQSADGKTTSVKPMPFVRKASDANGPFQPLKEYVTQHHAAYLPAITVPAQGAAGGTPAPTTGAAPTTAAAPTPGVQGAPAAVVVFGETSAAPGTPAVPSDPVEAILAQNAAAANAPNALRPQPAQR